MCIHWGNQPGFYYEGDGTGGGTSPAVQPTTPQAGAPPKPDDAPVDKEVKMTESALNKMIQDRLDQQKRSFDKQQKDVQDAAALEDARKKGELETVVAKHETTISKLTPKAEAAERLATSINKLVDSEIKDWPAELVQLDPGTDDAEKRMLWVEKSRDLAKRLLATGIPPNTQLGNPGGGARPSQKPGLDVTKTLNKYKGPAAPATT
jgi:hypothetical protein